MDFLQEGACPHHDLLAMLLANLTAPQAGTDALLQVKEGATAGLYLCAPDPVELSESCSFGMNMGSFMGFSTNQCAVGTPLRKQVQEFWLVFRRIDSGLLSVTARLVAGFTHPCLDPRIPCSQARIAGPAHTRHPARRALLLRRFLDSAGQQPNALLLRSCPRPFTDRIPCAGPCCCGASWTAPGSSPTPGSMSRWSSPTRHAAAPRARCCWSRGAASRPRWPSSWTLTTGA